MTPDRPIDERLMRVASRMRRRVAAFAFTLFSVRMEPTSGHHSRTAPEPENRGSDMLISCAVSTVAASCHPRCDRGCATAMLPAVHRHSENALKYAARPRKARIAHCHRHRMGTDLQPTPRWMRTLRPVRSDFDADLDESESARPHRRRCQKCTGQPRAAARAG